MNTAEPTIQVIATTTAPPPRSLFQRYRHLLQGRIAQFVLALVIAGGLSFLFWRILPLLYRFWDHSLTALLGALPLADAQLVTINITIPAWSDLETAAIGLPLAPPDLAMLSIHLGAAACLYLCAGKLHAPFRSPLRLLAVFHALCVLGSFALPEGGLYSIEEHTRSLSIFSQGLLLFLPAVMALTHFIVERSNERRILATVLIAAYLIVTLPVKLAAHALLIQTASSLAMPTLFLVFGPAFDIFVVTALYAWAVTWRHGQG
ncbi:MAG: putative rane protein [Proteobacteria bacterium]|nr:putative rane protein [Pseudomonadota bacterium]